MSDAREIVQPRWKRRATEIAEAIGGNSTGTSSVSLDSNTITELSQAIADAIDLKVLDINIKQYDDGLVSSSGLPIRTGTGPVSGGFLPLRVVTDIGDKVDINVKQYNDVDVDTRGLPVQAGRTTTNNTLVPLVVNCPTVNNFPSGGSGGTTTFPSTMDVNIVKFGGGPNISASAHLPITGFVDCRQDTGSLRPWIVSTGVQGSNTLGQWGTTTLSVTETNPVSGGGGGTSLTQQQVETAMDNALANATGISVTESAPVTTVAVNNHPTPVTTVSVDNHPTTTTITGSVAVQPALDANNVAIPLPVTETNPVTGGGGTTTGVQEVKIVGDDSHGIIMSKNYFNTNNQNLDYDCRGIGLGAYLGADGIQGVQGAVTSDGWIIRCNGVDIYNQDITLGLRGTTPTPTPVSYPQPTFGSLSASHPLLIPIFSQQVLDKYHGRKVTRSGVANIWIIEPVIKEEITGIVMTERYATTQGTGNAYFGSGFGEWTIRSNGTDIVDQSISEGLPLNAYTGQTGNNPFLNIQISNQATIDKYHGRKVTLSSVANVWIVEPQEFHLGDSQRGFVKFLDPIWSTGTTNQWNIMDRNGTMHYRQKLWDDGNTIVHTSGQDYNHDKYYGAQVINQQGDLWMVTYIDANPT